MLSSKFLRRGLMLSVLALLLTACSGGSTGGNGGGAGGALSIEADVALVLVQESVDEPPAPMEVGDAENVPVGAGVPATCTT